MIDESKYPVGYLLFSQVKISGANSISSPITYGFPAITGFLGAFHAMSRKLKMVPDLAQFSLDGVLIACHDCQPQVYRESNYHNYSFNQTRNPLKKNGATASIIEEGKCHLTVSFIVRILGEDEPSTEQQTLLIEKTKVWIQQQRMAGGSVHGLAKFQPVRFSIDANNFIPALMPAFVLMNADKEFKAIIDDQQKQQPDLTTLDILLDVCTVHHIPQLKEDGSTQWSTKSAKTGYGWLVPMPIGYQAISPIYPAGEMQNVRNPEYPNQYVETIYSLGKWLYPFHLKATNTTDRAFWRYEYRTEKSLYLVSQNNPFD